MTDTLMDLIERVERAPGGSREFDLAIDLFARPDEWAKVVHDNPETVNAYWLDDKELPRYTASIDAAMTLVPEGWRVSRIEQDWRSGRWIAQLSEQVTEEQRRRYDDGQTIGWNTADTNPDAPTPAIALCAASLKARMGTGG